MVAATVGTYSQMVMKPEEFDEAGALAADRRENRRAALVALIAVLVIGVASALLLMG
jgi:hypothetical protein